MHMRRFLISVAYSVPLFLVFSSIVGESIPFSFDAARDFVTAHVGKISLIGPPTGIPGIFYGPYWIWLIQSAFFISRNPAIVACIILTLPYFVLLPLILRKFSNLWGVKISVIIWLLFTLRYMSYFTSLWNPNLAPLLFWIVAYSAMRLGVVAPSKDQLFYSVLMGIMVGLILNIHLSFGIGVFLGSFLYIILRKKIRSVITFLLGTGLVYVPFIIFELRHGFRQLQAIAETLRVALWYQQSMVGHTGLHPIHIIDKFFRVIPADILYVSRSFATFLLLSIGGWFIVQLVVGKIRLKQTEKYLGLFLFLCSAAILGVFLASPNPVWEYHFIGVETIILLFFAIIMRHMRVVAYSAFIWVVVLVVLNVIAWSKSLDIDPKTLGGLATKRYIIDSIYQDIGQNSSFALNSYSPSLYTYDYDYLVQWHARRFRKLMPVAIENAQTVYLIIPPTSAPIFEDFVHYRTPDDQFETANSWLAQDNTTILKRIRKKYE